MNLRHKGIIDLFTKYGKQPFDIWFSGKYREGEYKVWHETGQILQHSSWKNRRPNSEMWEHSVWKNGKKVRDIQ